jgi:hypothetical protein
MRICGYSGCTHVFTDLAPSARNYHWEQKRSKHAWNNGATKAHWNNKPGKQSVDPFVGPVNKKEYDVLRHTSDKEGSAEGSSATGEHPSQGLPAPPEGSRSKKDASVGEDSNDASSAPPESIERVHVGSISGVPTSNRVLVILTADD